MKKMMIKRAIALLCVVACVGAVGCGPDDEVPDTEETLQLHVADSGYGTKWCSSMLELFQQQDWVKEKYPNLIVDLVPDSDNLGYNFVLAGPQMCTYDVICTLSGGNNYFLTKDSNGQSYFEELSDVFESEVPGEGITLKEKLDPSMYEIQQTEMLDGSIEYYAVPYLNSSMGMLYNETVIKRAFGENYKMPNTTTEFYQFCEDLVDKEVVPIISCAGDNYWESMFPIWWAQYEGIEEYKNFWYGTKSGKFDSSVTQQLGRKYSLMVLDSLLNAGNGFIHPDSTIKSTDFLQRYFIAGMGAITCNGDWFTAEMDQDTNHIRWFKVPVISYITEKCNSVKTDAQLSAVVDYVDANQTYEAAAENYSNAGYGTLEKTDYERIYEARNCVFARGGAQFSVPAYAKGKQVAIDFIRFCATDIAIEAMMDATSGFISPYKFTPNAEKLANYEPLWRDRLTYASTARYVPNCSLFRLYYLGGLTMLRTPTDKSFMASNEKDRRDPTDLYNDYWHYYMDNNNANWNAILEKAGL